MNLFEPGKKYFIQTVTNYFVGEAVAVVDGFVQLSSASWIAHTGRFADCLKNGSFREVEPFASDVFVSISAIVNFTEWTHELPDQQK